MKKCSRLFALVIASAIVLAGCGSSTKYMAPSAATEEAYSVGAAYDNGYDYDVAEEAMVDNSDSSVTVNESAQTNRKLIKTINLTVETLNFTELNTKVEAKVAALGGYIESSSVSGSKEYRNRYANYTVRIPKANADAFVEMVNEAGNVCSRSESVEDVTLSYVDLESHKKALESEYSRLLELMDQAETIEDIIYIEDRLTNVRYQMESMESQLRTYDNKIDYTTIYLSIDEVKEVTIPEPETVGQRITSGFSESVKDVSEGLVDFFVWFIIHIPQLVIFAIIVVAIIFIRKKLPKRSKKPWKSKKGKEVAAEEKTEEPEEKTEWKEENTNE